MGSRDCSAQYASNSNDRTSLRNLKASQFFDSACTIRVCVGPSVPGGSCWAGPPLSDGGPASHRARVNNDKRERGPTSFRGFSARVLCDYFFLNAAMSDWLIAGGQRQPVINSKESPLLLFPLVVLRCTVLPTPAYDL